MKSSKVSKKFYKLLLESFTVEDVREIVEGVNNSLIKLSQEYIKSAARYKNEIVVSEYLKLCGNLLRNVADNLKNMEISSMYEPSEVVNSLCLQYIDKIIVQRYGKKFEEIKKYQLTEKDRKLVSMFDIELDLEKDTKTIKRLQKDGVRTLDHFYQLLFVAQYKVSESFTENFVAKIIAKLATAFIINGSIDSDDSFETTSGIKTDENVTQETVIKMLQGSSVSQEKNSSVPDNQKEMSLFERAKKALSDLKNDIKKLITSSHGVTKFFIILIIIALIIIAILKVPILRKFFGSLKKFLLLPINKIISFFRKAPQLLEAYLTDPVARRLIETKMRRMDMYATMYLSV